METDTLNVKVKEECERCQNDQIDKEEIEASPNGKKEQINVTIKSETNLMCMGSEFKVIDDTDGSPTSNNQEKNKSVETMNENPPMGTNSKNGQIKTDDENGQIKTLINSSENDVVDNADSSENEENEDAIVPGVMNNDSVKSSKGNLKRKRARPAKRIRKLKKQKIVKNSSSKVSKPEPEISNKDDQDQKSLESSKEDQEYYLKVTNLPSSWSYMEIKNYIDTECGPVDEMEMLKDGKTGKGAIRLSFPTEEECKKALNKLQEKDVAGNNLVLEMTVETLESDSEPQSETTEDSSKPWKPDLDSWEVDLQGMYGLKLPFLRSLGITPPLDKWVHVSNFRCDKAELRDVMEMAGNVQMCAVFTVANRYANVMYSHPLEAVQAVSMLNNQQFYGQQLKVAMDRSPNNTILLPKGLSDIGKGLGLNGKPLRNIVKHYERFVDNKDCLINPAFFDIPENHSMQINSDSSTFNVKSVEDFNHPVKNKSPKVRQAATAQPIEIIKRDVVHTPVYNSMQQNRPLAPLRGNVQRAPFVPSYRPAPMMNPAPGPMGPMGHPGPMAGPIHPGFAQPFNVPRPAWGGPGPMYANPNEPVKLMLNNLPPSTTFALLCSKMSEWGHVVCIQLTTPGCATVTFANRMQADSCFQYYNGRNIDNYFIQVAYA